VTKNIKVDLGESLANQLLEEHGPLISGEDLWKTIGFTSASAFKQAKSKHRLDIPVFSLPNRRGSYAFTMHVADWLRKLAKEAEMK